MAAFLKKTICFLFDEETNDKTFSDDYDGENLCKERNNVDNFKDFELFYPEAPTEWKYITVVRDPVDRFISRFLMQCVINEGNCYGCSANMTCFLEKQRELLTKVYTNADIENLETSFIPQTWHCDFNKPFEKVLYSSEFITTEDTASKLIQSFQSQRVSIDVLKYIEERFQFHKNQEESQIREFLEKRFYSNDYLIELLVSCYYWDFVLLNFPFPQPS